MPKAVKIKGGYKVVHKLTGKTLHVYKGAGAKSRAAKVVAGGY